MFWTPANFFLEQPFTPKAGLMPHYTAWSGGIAVLPDGNSLINTWLQPGVSRAKRRRAVSTACRLHKKPLKRFPASTRHDTGLKPGVNEKQITQTASEQSKILPTVSAKSSSSISQALSAKFSRQGLTAFFQMVSEKFLLSANRQTMPGKSPVPISATPSRKLDAEQIVQTLSGKSSTLHFHPSARIARAPDAPKII